MAKVDIPWHDLKVLFRILSSLDINSDGSEKS